jgi:hypothetical protein
MLARLGSASLRWQVAAPRAINVQSLAWDSKPRLNRSDWFMWRNFYGQTLYGAFGVAVFILVALKTIHVPE